MRKTRWTTLITMLVLAGSFAPEYSIAQNLEGQWAAGVVLQESQMLSGAATYSGGAVQFWPYWNQAIQLGFAVQTEGHQNFRFHGEYQKHFFRRHTDLHSVFVGGGLFYEDARGDDWIAVYAPIGFRLQLREYPVSFTINTSVRLIVDPETSLEAFNEVRLAAFYAF